jgi:hypothetical protein
MVPKGTNIPKTGILSGVFNFKLIILILDLEGGFNYLRRRVLNNPAIRNTFTEK